MMIHIGGKNQSYLSHLDPKSIQPNAVDLRLDKVWKLYDSTFELKGEVDDQAEIKCHRQSIPVEPNPDGYLYLWPGVYSVVFQGTVTMGEDEAGFVVPRSTLVRNGVFITSGLYDSGYHGTMNACLHVNGGLFKVTQGTRLAQFLLFEAQSLNQYTGSYQTKTT